MTDICPVCNQPKEDGCTLSSHKPIGHEPLLYEHWLAIWDFMKFIYLPFIHAVILDARQKEEQK